MSDELQPNATLEAAEPEEFQWFEFSGWRWAFFNILIWLLPFLLVLGIVFNLLCFITILINKKLFPKIARQNMLIITGCDVAVLAVYGTYFYHRAIKFTLLTTSPVLVLMDHVNDSSGACKFLLYFVKFLMNGTPFFHVGLTLERVLAVVMPLKVKQIMTVKRNCLLLLVLTILGSLGPALWASEFFYDGKRCRPLTDHELLFRIDDIQYNVDFYLSKLALFVVLLLGCVIVTVALCRQTQKAAQISASEDKARRSRTIIGTCVVMLLMNVIFFLSHGPRAAMSVYEGYSNIYGFASLTEAEIQMIYEVLFWIGFLHNIVDPFAYLMGKGFRGALMKALRTVFRAPFCRRNRRERSTMSVRNTGASG